MTRISHSGKETYLTCQEKWRLHYQERLRSPVLSSPLFLGGAFDEALNCMLVRLKNPLDHSEEDNRLVKLDPHEVLDKHLSKTTFNGQEIDIARYQYAKYFSKDFTPEMLEPEDFMVINSTAEEFGFEQFDVEICKEFVHSCKNEIKTKKALEKESQILYNLIHWCCCRRKLHYLLDRYEEDVLPLLEEVFSVQKKVELTAGEHNLIGYIDFVASFKDEPGVKYVCDNKLASKAYPSDAIDDAVQLATYCEHEELKKAAFVVTEKGLRKRDPKHRIQILRGEITEELFEKTFDEFGEVVYNIEQGIFEKTGMDGSKQECFHFGQRCVYYNTCRGEPDKDFLVKLEDK
jgi:hypothetical protein